MKKEQIRKKPVKKLVCFGFIGLAIILLLVAYASTTATKTMTSCIFCDIVAGKSPNTTIEYETSEYVIFRDIKPASTNHFLCVTKRHIESLKAMTRDDISLIERMQDGMIRFFQSQDIDTNDALFGFHMPPFISVKHLHMHGISPRSNMSWTNSFMFKPYTYWFKTVDEAINYLNNKTS